jgi:hypothetical protein
MNPSDLKVGMLVTVKRTGRYSTNRFMGQTGVVTVIDTDGTCFIKVSLSKEGWVSISALEPADVSADKPLAVGNNVKITETGSWFPSDYVGTTAKIRIVDNGDRAYFLESNDGERFWLPWNYAKPVDEDLTPTSAIADAITGLEPYAKMSPHVAAAVALLKGALK